MTDSNLEQMAKDIMLFSHYHDVGMAFERDCGCFNELTSHDLPRLLVDSRSGDERLDHYYDVYGHFCGSVVTRCFLNGNAEWIINNLWKWRETARNREDMARKADEGGLPDKKMLAKLCNMLLNLRRTMFAGKS